MPGPEPPHKPRPPAQTPAGKPAQPVQGKAQTPRPQPKPAEIPANMLGAKMHIGVPKTPSSITDKHINALSDVYGQFNRASHAAQTADGTHLQQAHIASAKMHSFVLRTLESLAGAEKIEVSQDARKKITEGLKSRLGVINHQLGFAKDEGLLREREFAEKLLGKLDGSYKPSRRPAIVRAPKTPDEHLQAFSAVYAGIVKMRGQLQAAATKPNSLGQVQVLGGRIRELTEEKNNFLVAIRKMKPAEFSPQAKKALGNYITERTGQLKTIIGDMGRLGPTANATVKELTAEWNELLALGYHLFPNSKRP